MPSKEEAEFRLRKRSARNNRYIGIVVERILVSRFLCGKRVSGRKILRKFKLLRKERQEHSIPVCRCLRDKKKEPCGTCVQLTHDLLTLDTCCDLECIKKSI